MESKVEKSRKKTGGRVAGTPNKVTQEAREAVRALLDANLPYLQTWLQTTADGVFDDQSGKWIVPPNPGKACDIVQNMVEYAVPKLARTEVVGDEKTPVRMVVSWKK